MKTNPAKLTVLVAPSGFKESVTPTEAVNRIRKGIYKVFPNANIIGIPAVDGGEGTTRALVELTNGEIIETRVVGPVGDEVDSFIGILGGDGPKTVVLEMAASSGLTLVPRNRRNPELTTTYGVGQLISLALDQDPEVILIGCGDSGTSDGGAGMVQALGARFLDEKGNEIGYGSKELARLQTVDLANLDPRLERVRIYAALNHKNVLTGPQGVARKYGPQKGATPEQVESMAAALDHYADLVLNTTGVEVANTPGCGASGGLGAGLLAFLGANLHPRFDVILPYLGIEEALPTADLVITAEGGIDFQTPSGKVPALLAELATQHNIPVVVLAGVIGKGADDNYNAGIWAFNSVQSGPISLEAAIAKGAESLEAATARMMRFINVGMNI